MFCKNCGNELGVGQNFCNCCGAPEGAGDKYCAECGIPVASGSAFCSNCGTPMPRSGGAPYADQNMGANNYGAYNAYGQPQTPGVCHVCNQTLEPGNSICVYCGTPVAAQQPMQPPMQPPMQQPYMPNYGNVKGKSRMLCAFMALFLGHFGVHHFIMGYGGRGAAKIILTLCGLFTCGITTLVSCIWALVDAIRLFSRSIKVDARGIPLE